jgi:glyoxylase-like metal-dependent hydrolase (beta-lactamase superfamily II)
MTIIINENDILIERLVLGPYETNCYTLLCKKTQQSLVVDAPADVSGIIDALQGTVPRYILLTHDHYDHTGTLVSLRSRLKVPLAAHAADATTLNTPPSLHAGTQTTCAGMSSGFLRSQHRPFSTASPHDGRLPPARTFRP